MVLHNVPWPVKLIRVAVSWLPTIDFSCILFWLLSTIRSFVVYVLAFCYCRLLWLAMFSFPKLLCILFSVLHHLCGCEDIFVRSQRMMIITFVCARAPANIMIWTVNNLVLWYYLPYHCISDGLRYLRLAVLPLAFHPATFFVVSMAMESSSACICIR